MRACLIFSLVLLGGCGDSSSVGGALTAPPVLGASWLPPQEGGELLASDLPPDEHAALAAQDLPADF